jgi:bifunctional non-homologous end joining protein LigD
VALEVYRKKRQFGVTPEPRGRKGRRGGDRYVIQKHAARRLHYDLRLELDGVMKSWAVTRGPSLDPGEKRLAVQVEDHPIEYNTFEGTIPEGEYGGGTVMIWDRGRWSPEGDPHKGFAKGHLVFDLDGEKLHGRWHLVRMRGRPNDRHDNWLLIKGKDDEARGTRTQDILKEKPLSAATGRSMDEIAGGKGKKRVWHSNRTNAAAEEPALQSQRAFKEELRAARAKSGPTKARAKTEARHEAKPRAEAPARARAKSKAKPKSAATRTLRKTGDPPPQSGGRSARLPDFIPPSLATLHTNPPSGPEWLHEIKFDGYRIEARLDRGEVTLLTRNRQDWTHRFTPIAEAVAKLPADTALLDGELVVEDDDGISSFSLLQTDLKEGRSDRFVYWVFDLLYLDGRDLKDEPLAARKAALQRLLRGKRTGPIRYAEDFDAEGPAFLASACQMGLEGVISKRRDAPYRPGRSDNFIKSKCHDEQEFVVVGFTPSTATRTARCVMPAASAPATRMRPRAICGSGWKN